MSQHRNMPSRSAERIVECSVHLCADTALWCLSESKCVQKQVTGCTAESSLEGHFTCNYGLSEAWQSLMKHKKHSSSANMAMITRSDVT